MPNPCLAQWSNRSGMISSVQEIKKLVTQFRTVCYVASWAMKRTGSDVFQPEDIDASLCTHLVMAFAKLDENGHKIVPDAQQDIDLYRRLVALKNDAPDLKVMLSLGGWAVGTEEFSLLASNPTNINEFSTSTIDFLRHYGFDGLDIDWEYPGSRGNPPEDREHFTQLLRGVKTAFAEEQRRDGLSQLILSAAISSAPTTLQSAYEMPTIMEYLDFANIMTYDLHGHWDDVIGHHSSLYSPTDDVTDSIDYAIDLLINTTVPREKMNLGLPFYGRTFNVSDPANAGIGVAHQGPGEAGPTSSEDGVLVYSEICKLMADNPEGIVSGRLNGVSSPYIVDGTRWIGYDDTISIREKVDYVVENGLGGVMVWSIDMDDPSGLCSEENFPLLHTIQTGFQEAIIG